MTGTSVTSGNASDTDRLASEPKRGDTTRAAQTLPSVEGGPDEQWRPLRMSTALWLQLGASRVEWGEPDADGFYTPTLYGDPAPTLDVERLARALWMAMREDAWQAMSPLGALPPNMVSAAIARAYEEAAPTLDPLAEARADLLDRLAAGVEGLHEEEWRDCMGDCHGATVTAVLALIEEVRK